MFLGRKAELAQLEQWYAAPGFQCIAVSGERGLGKSALLKEFIRGKSAIYHQAIAGEDELQHLSEDIAQQFRDGHSSVVAPCYSSIAAAFEALFLEAQSRRLVLVIDEYQYLSKTHREITGTLQKLADRYRSSTQLMLILCTPCITCHGEPRRAHFVPLGDLPTGVLPLTPLPFREANLFFPSFSYEDRLALYGIAGGYPRYFLQFHNDVSLEENIRQVYLNCSSLLFLEPSFLLHFKTGQSSPGENIFRAIAHGAARRCEILDCLDPDLGEAYWTSWLRRLVSAGFLRKEYPFGAKSSRRPRYVFTDHMFRFWSRFIYDQENAISHPGSSA